MHERPKVLPQQDRGMIELRKRKQNIFEQAIRGLARDLEGFLRAVARGGGGGGVLSLRGSRVTKTEEEIVQEVLRAQREMPRPWRSHQKKARRQGYRNRQGRRHGLFYRNP